MLHLPPITRRGIGPLRRYLYDKAHRAQLNIATKTSPLVEICETRWLVVSNAKRKSLAFTGHQPLLFTDTADGLFLFHRPLVGDMYRYLHSS